MKILILFICILAALSPFLITYNLTPSVPVGFYIRTLNLDRNSYIRFQTDYTYPWLPTNSLLKQVAALPGEQVTITVESYYVNGKLIGTKKKADSLGNQLPDYRFDGTVPPDHIFVRGLGDSFDSRYYGPVKIGDVEYFIPFGVSVGGTP